MAAYAAAVSLLQILKQLQVQPSSESDQFSNIHYPDSQLIQLLQDKVCFLKEFLERTCSLKYWSEDRDDDLESQIRDAIYEAEDMIETTVSAHFLSSDSETASSREENYMPLLQRVVQDIDSIVGRTKELSGEVGLDLTLPWSSDYGFSSRYAVFHQDIIVGRSDALEKLQERLMRGLGMFKVVPIVGVPGIGKTILAQLVYNDLRVRKYFEICAWVKVSPQYRKRDVLLGLLRSMKKLGVSKLQETDDQLAKYLYNSLKHRRYLVVLDDLPDIEAWNDLKELFPDHNDRSRVMLTTRKVDVARFASNNGPFYELPLLSIDESWLLLGRTVFGDQECPLELEEIARDMATNCWGLPLVIVTLGGFLAEASNITDWKMAASAISRCKNHDELIRVVVSLSYKSLPQHLKACLLYMGIFPDNNEIPVSKLIHLWIAEGFLEHMCSGLMLEEVGEKDLLRLARRRLVSVGNWSFNNKMKTCRIHESYRDFFMVKAKEEKFFHVINKDTNGFLEDACNHRRLCILKNIPFGSKDVAEYNSKASISKARSLLCGGPQHQFPLREWLDFKLLKVLDALNIRFYRFPLKILKLVQLRYLAFTYNGVVPASVRKLWNLQFLIVLQYLSTKCSGTPLHLPMEIWNMQELRHLQVMGRDLPDPSTVSGENDNERGRLPLMEYLLTLSGVSSHSCTPRVLQRIPNLKKLGIRIGSLVRDAENFSFLSHLGNLHRLETLKCVVMHPDLETQRVSSLPVFPLNLRKLSLSGCGFPWEYMSCIGSLPILEVLKLRCYAFQGPVWEPIEGGFCSLKFLLLEDLDIEHWIADSSHFPRLQHLILRHCYKLREIPYEIGEIPTLETLELDDCSPLLAMSARLIKEEQEELGNDGVQFPFHSSSDD